jgi:hypothetical protein
MMLSPSHRERILLKNPDPAIGNSLGRASFDHSMKVILEQRRQFILGDSTDHLGTICFSDQSRDQVIGRSHSQGLTFSILTNVWAT